MRKPSHHFQGEWLISTGSYQQRRAQSLRQGDSSSECLFPRVAFSRLAAIGFAETKDGTESQESLRDFL
jgi:hypothetical protein